MSKNTAATIIEVTGETTYCSRSKALSKVGQGVAEIVHEIPLTIRIINNRGYFEELRQQIGRVTRISRNQPNRAPVTVASKSSRAKPPRHSIGQPEREFQEYKTDWHIRRGDEEQERARLRRRA